MKNQNDLTHTFGTLYRPKAALVIFQSQKGQYDFYIEHYDMDEHGTPTNAHPLTIREAQQLSKALQMEKQCESAFLKTEGILSANILKVDSSGNGKVIWFTKAVKRNLFFKDSLEIPNGQAHVPPMLWMASKTGLYVFALKSNSRPNENTNLYHAPFFNLYTNGKVCMGTVDVNIKTSASLEEFTQQWEAYFFNSYFSHLLENRSPVKGNCVSLWKSLMQNDEPFPKDRLLKNNRTLKNLYQ